MKESPFQNRNRHLTQELEVSEKIYFAKTTAHGSMELP
jgi:hypothetical protein